jgi:hypothetical protein
MSDFWEEGISENVCRIRYDHYEKKRAVRMKQVNEFMVAIKNQNKQSSVEVQLSKESRQELKKCQGNIKSSNGRRLLERKNTSSAHAAAQDMNSNTITVGADYTHANY